MTRIKTVAGILCILIGLVSCGAMKPNDLRPASLANGPQSTVRTRLEQTLFNEVVARFTAAHPPPVESADYQALLSELARTVALTEITPDQQQTLKALRWSVDRQRQAPSGARLPASSLAELRAWLKQELKQLRQTRMRLGPADPSLFQTVGSNPKPQQQFLDLIQSSIKTHRLLNPLELKFSNLAPLLVKPFFLDFDAPFFYQLDDASIRITAASFHDLSFPEAEVIALRHGLPGSHFLAQQQNRAVLFAEDQAANQQAISVLLLAAMGQVTFYQTPYSQAARIDFLTLTLARYQKAANPSQSFDEFKRSIGLTHYSDARLSQAFTATETAPKPLVLQAQTLQVMSRFVGITLSEAQEIGPGLPREFRDQILILLRTLQRPLGVMLDPLAPTGAASESISLNIKD